MLGKLIAVVAIALTPTVHEGYQEAYAASQADGKPLVVVISASWCGPCQKLHKDILRDPSSTSGVHLVFVDYQSDVAKRIKTTGSVPEIIKYKHTKDGWVKEVKVGYQNLTLLKKWFKT